MVDQDRKPTQSGDEALLLEIRDRYKYASEAWEEIRKERQKDLRYICGDPWEPEDRKARADAGRPVVNHDELNQYVNQAVNNLRQNKRGIKSSPAGMALTASLPGRLASRSLKRLKKATPRSMKASTATISRF